MASCKVPDGPRVQTHAAHGVAFRRRFGSLLKAILIQRGLQVREGVGNSYVSAAVERAIERRFWEMNHHVVGKNKPSPTPNTRENFLLWFFSVIPMKIKEDCRKSFSQIMN